MKPTPETDALFMELPRGLGAALAKMLEHAQKLERERDALRALPEELSTKPAFNAGVKWGREMYPEDRNAVIEECAILSECAEPNDGRDHSECPFCCTAKEIRALKLTPSPQPRTREDEARECLAIARNYAGSWLSPTADEIVTALERRVNEHAGNVLQSPPDHNLYREGDPGAPDSIKDRNGEIVLGLCKRCGRGEAELTEPCSQPQLWQSK